MVELPDTLPEYSNNPFIAQLPRVQTRLQMLNMLGSQPIFNEVERTYPTHLRKHCILRLAQYFEPLDRHVQFSERFDMLLRQGYLSRNPLTHDYMFRLQNSHDRKMQRNAGTEPLNVFESFASSFALIGASGIGKSRTIARVLSHYPQIIEHITPFTLSQIVWVRLDCPSQGSQIQLCRNFFYAVDLLLGTNYQVKYAGKHRALDDMLLAMGHIANLHAIGVLVIDEIQFLRSSKNDRDALLRFFVTLVNTIGIPVVLVGTNSALPILQDNFKEARRANGLGSMMWDPIQNNSNWGHFVKKLWEYQWLSTYTPLTDEIIDVLHEESQGIIDILIKLFMLVQMRIISVREAKQGDELITVALIRRVAREDFRMVRPMLDALKRNDMKLLCRFDDLLPFQSHFDILLNKAIQSVSVIDHIPPKPNVADGNQDDISQKLQGALKAAGVSEDIMDILIKDAMIRNPSGDFMLLMGDIIRVMQSEKADSSKPKKPKLVRQPVNQLPKEDLRYIAANGPGEDLYTRLLNGGVLREPLQEVAA